MPRRYRALFVTIRPRRQVVEPSLLAPVGFDPLFLLEALAYTLQGLESLPFDQPTAAVRLERLFAVLNDALLRPHGIVESRQEPLVVLPVRRVYARDTLGFRGIVVSIIAELTELLHLRIELRLVAAGHLPEPFLFGVGQHHDPAELLRTCGHAAANPPARRLRCLPR